MISIVCAYNKKKVFEDILMKGLDRQIDKFELIAIDNTGDNRGHVADAMNRGGCQATEKYIMFIHQDVELISPTWLRDVERILDSIPNLGVAGVAGARREGGRDFNAHLVGRIKSGNQEWGIELKEPVRVQTIDELLVIIPREVFEENLFDSKTFDFIHLFGADYCLNVAQRGLDIYAIPGYVFHASTGNFIGIDKYRVRIFMKHRDVLPIFTTCGEISYRTIMKPVILSFLPKRAGIYLRNIRNHIIGRKTDARGASIQ
jgi:GT2 family glycosyltransferase